MNATFVLDRSLSAKFSRPPSLPPKPGVNLRAGAASALRSAGTHRAKAAVRSVGRLVELLPSHSSVLSALRLLRDEEKKVSPAILIVCAGK